MKADNVNVQSREITLGIIQTTLTTSVISHVVVKGGSGSLRGDGRMFRTVCVKQLLTN